MSRPGSSGRRTTTRAGNGGAGGGAGGSSGRRTTTPRPARPPAARAARPHRIFTTAVAAVYPLYLAKLEKKGRGRHELDEVLRWLTGFDAAALAHHLAAGTTFEAFFAAARLNPAAETITGVVCGVRVEEVADPLMRRIRYLDKLVDELARGRPLAAVLRA